ncbi:hypothetical protein DE146DRAFT_663561 [Phaeosphaeria sp. MPI-PUGE-AT-0046c]|nr:hypothetical protein DE146DRAFT_663561 [Phaeosphaeria sp. MPI-PUGE-AT-0046c]
MHMTTSAIVVLQAGLLAVTAAPVPLGPDPIIIEGDDNIIYMAEHPDHRVTAIVLCIFYASLLAFAQGYRAGRVIGRKATTKLSDILVFVQGFICIAFLFAVAIGTAGLGLATEGQCYAAIRICIVMYATAKLALTLFLLERVRIIRAPFVERGRDPLWIIGATTTICGYTIIMGLELIAPQATNSRVDGICRIGIQPHAAIAMLVLDTVLNVTLTSIFVWQLRPAITSLPHRLSNHAPSRMRNCRLLSMSRVLEWKNSTYGGAGRSTSENNVRLMIIRNIVGSILLLMNTIANNAIFLTWSFARMSHACFLMCLTDLVLGMLITHWLSMRSLACASQTDSGYRASLRPDSSFSHPSVLDPQAPRVIKEITRSCSNNIP